MIIMLGDIHGNFNYIKHQIHTKNMSDCTIIQVGDFGIGFSHKETSEKDLIDLNDFFQTKNIQFLAIRGNHDDPSFFDGSYSFSNLRLLSDYTVLNLEGNNFLFIGGAISVDRTSRITSNNSNIKYGSKKREYWDNEKIEYRPEIVKNIKGIDVVVTHTAPDWCEPSNKLGFGSLVLGFAKVDKDLIKDLSLERNQMSNIFIDLYQNNTIKSHYYGHFHKSHVDYYGNTKHTLLDINEFLEHR
jgi:DNA repair exonuclease SbcCD nuclease subunit